MDNKIREVLTSYGRMPVDVASIDRHADLYAKGLTSHASVNVMLALEDSFDVEFPDALLRKSTFESISSIESALLSLGIEAA